MGYKNPIVCKEVYLPYPILKGNMIASVDDYKKVFGIDLKELFDFELFTPSAGRPLYHVIPKNPYTKFYLVADNDQSGFAMAGVQPLVCIGGEAHTFRVIEGEETKETTYSTWNIYEDYSMEISEI